MRPVVRGPGPGRSFRFAALLVLLAGAGAAQDLGYPGPSYAGAAPEPTESKPESKLWFHAGRWWSVLWSTPGDAFHLHRLDQQTHAWTDTGAFVDERPSAKSDVLASGEVVYVASHRIDSGNGSSGNPVLLWRFRYAAGADDYAPDPGFPVTIASFSTEALTLARDSTGTLWAAWKQSKRIHVAHSVGGDDAVWVAPYVLPPSDTDVSSDDLCATIHFGGSSLGVFWSDQNANDFRFAIHADGAADDDWSVETPLAGESDDHVNLAADAAGRVFAAVKNGDDEIKLLVRDAGAWTQHLVTTGVERFTRPLVLLDEDARLIHVFASGQDDGHIHHKTSSLDAVGFAPGTGTVVLRDASDPLVNNATSTKQNVDGTTGLVVLAAHETTQQYWHHSVPPDDLLVAAFTAEAFAGDAPFEAHFVDQSSGPPAEWSWDFGDGASSTEPEPVHVYAVPGTYDVTLTVTDADGSDSETRAGLVTVEEALPTQVFAPVADTRAEQSSPGTSFGDSTQLRVRLEPAKASETFLRFDLATLAAPVVSARLRLFCLDGSTLGAHVFPTSGAWNEATLTWNTRPAATGPLVTTLGSITTGTWVELDVTAAVTGPGPLDLLLRSSSSNLAVYASRESPTPPELVVRTTALAPPVADFTASPTSGPAPLAVGFTDLSSSGPIGWSWDFGDGQGSSERHPTHVYSAAGTYGVTLTATNAQGDSTLELEDLVVVTPPAAPTADFAAVPTSGAAPLLVAFTDLSSGWITQWAWDFGDGGNSDEPAPEHEYAAQGTYSVTLTVTGPGGVDAETKAGLVVVSPAPTMQTLVASADARVSEGSPSSNAGSATELRVRTEPGGSYSSYVRFDVPALGGPLVSATLRLFCTDESPLGGRVLPTSSAWGESTLTWNNRPPASGPELAAIGPVTAGVWYEVDVTADVSAPGPLSFLLTSTSSNSALYSSREGTHSPELVLVIEPPEPDPPVADFEAAPRSGHTPLLVAFTDASSGDITTWAWDFGDGTGSSERDPAHVYVAPGTYDVTLMVTGPGGMDTRHRTGFIVVRAAPRVLPRRDPKTKG